MADKKLKAIIETQYNGKGVDQAEKDLGQLGKQAGKTKEQLTGMGGATAKANTNLLAMAKSLAGPALGFLSLTSAIGGTISFLRGSINDWVNYNEEMRKLGDATGSSTEDLSRLLQAADDVGVEMGAMTTAMSLMAKNGIKPTIENFAALSDSLLSIKDDTKRSEEMQKIFGRGWAEVATFVLQGSDAIRDSTGAINDNLVVTANSAQESRDYALAIDSLKDSFTGLKNGIARVALPGLTDMSEALGEAADNMADMNRQAIIATFGFKEFLRYMQGDDIYQIAEDMINAENAVKAFDAAVENKMLTDIQANDILREVQLNHASLIDLLAEYGIVVDATTDKIANETRAYEQSIPALQYYASQTGNAKDATKELGDAAQSAGRKVAWLFDKLDTDISGDIAKSLEQIAYKLNFGDVVNESYNKAKQAILDGKISPAQGKEILSGLFVAAEALKVKGGEIDFREAAKNISENLEMPLKDAAGWLSYLVSKDGKTLSYTALLKILYQGVGRDYEPYRPGQSGSKTEDSGSGPKGATGLDMIVPAGYPGDSFPIWAQSGERVTITPPGKTAPGSTITFGNIVINESANPQATANAVIAAINSRMRQSRISGSKYATG